MEFLTELWLPILLSAVAVWFASAIAWMALPHHKDDYGKLPDENAFTNAVRSSGVKPGAYAFPHCGDKAQSKDPEFMKRWNEGPSGFMTIFGKFNMGRNMVLSFLVYLVISVFIGYIGWQAVTPGASFGAAFRFLGAAGMLGYCFSSLPHQIWFGTPRRAVITNLIDAVVYGLVTGAVFAFLWPDAAAVVPAITG